MVGSFSLRSAPYHTACPPPRLPPTASLAPPGSPPHPPHLRPVSPGDPPWGARSTGGRSETAVPPPTHPCHHPPHLTTPARCLTSGPGPRLTCSANSPPSWPAGKRRSLGEFLCSMFDRLSSNCWNKMKRLIVKDLLEFVLHSDVCRLYFSWCKANMI